MYTATFSVGVGLSFLIAQLAADALGLALGLLYHRARAAGDDRGLPRDGARRSRCRRRAGCSTSSLCSATAPALGYILGYGAHCFELYALRTWIVAFWTYVAARNGGSALLEPITVSVIAAVLAMPSSIIGNEAAIRFGRHRAIVLFMCIAGIVATLIGVRGQRSARSCCWPCCSSTRSPFPPTPAR